MVTEDPVQQRTKPPALWRSYWQALLLSPRPFHDLRGARGGFWFGIRFFLLVILIASLGKLFAGVQIVQQPTLAERVTGVAVEIETCAAKLPRILAQPVQEAAGWVEALADGITEVQPPLGVRASKLIRLVGEWLSVPLTMLGAWMGWSLGVWVVARAMGALGSLRDHLSLSMLAVAPQVLTFANYVPAWGGPLEYVKGALALVALIWSLMILTRALSVVHEVEHLRALKILGASFLIYLVLIPYLLILPVWLALALLLS